jgi:hypothetical protein
MLGAECRPRALCVAQHCGERDHLNDRIDANSAGDYSVCLLRHGGMLLVIRSPYQKPLGAEARPVHPILRGETGASLVVDGGWTAE